MAVSLYDTILINLVTYTGDIPVGQLAHVRTIIMAGKTYSYVIIRRKLGKIDCPRTDGLCLHHCILFMDIIGKFSFG